MAYVYVYNGDEPTVFVTLLKDGSTWTPNKGDTISSETEIDHPLLSILPSEDKKIAASKSVAKDPEPVEPVQDESPETADETEEN